MTDIACWRQNQDQVVVRIRGNEFLMDEAEAIELAKHIDNVVYYGKKESLSEDYKALRSRRKAMAEQWGNRKELIANLKVAMGLAPKTGSFRR